MVPDAPVPASTTAPPTGSLPPDPFREIRLPDGSDPVTKGIIRRITHEDGVLTVEIAVDGLGALLAERITEQIRGAALALPGTEHARVLPAHQTRGQIEIPGVARVVAVASTKGGVGKTTVAVNLARTLTDQGLRVGLFDADIYGPNIPHLLGLTGPILTNDHGQPVPLDADGIQVLSPGLIADPPTVRRGAIAYGAIESLLGQGAWTDRDLVIVDMPAGADDVTGAVLEYVPLDGAVFVTTPFDASVDDTHRTMTVYADQGVPAIAAVVNMNTHTCACCGHTTRLFPDAVDLDAPTVHDLPFDPGLQRDPGPEHTPAAFAALADTATKFLDRLDAMLPEGALDLRGLPPRSQATQVLDEITTTHDPRDPVTVVVDDPDWITSVLHTTPGRRHRIARYPTGSTGEILELTHPTRPASITHEPPGTIQH